MSNSQSQTASPCLPSGPLTSAPGWPGRARTSPSERAQTWPGPATPGRSGPYDRPFRAGDRRGPPDSTRAPAPSSATTSRWSRRPQRRLDAGHGPHLPHRREGGSPPPTGRSTAGAPRNGPPGTSTRRSAPMWRAGRCPPLRDLVRQRGRRYPRRRRGHGAPHRDRAARPGPQPRLDQRGVERRSTASSARKKRYGCAEASPPTTAVRHPRPCRHRRRLRPPRRRRRPQPARPGPPRPRDCKEARQALAPPPTPGGGSWRSSRCPPPRSTGGRRAGRLLVHQPLPLQRSRGAVRLRRPARQGRRPRSSAGSSPSGR